MAIHLGSKWMGKFPVVVYQLYNVGRVGGGMVVTTLTYWNITISLVELTDLVKSVQYCWTFNQLIEPHPIEPWFYPLYHVGRVGGGMVVTTMTSSISSSLGASGPNTAPLSVSS